EFLDEEEKPEESVAVADVEVVAPVKKAPAKAKKVAAEEKTEETAVAPEVEVAAPVKKAPSKAKKAAPEAEAPAEEKPE
ncbi:MAG: hypothetical protein HGA86_08245, partial [Anaerolineaceae bacterium]|nr:hypothetical protein [Anaerolineaceae bacterium]